MAGSSQKSVLFVCLGNICRSPIAEAVFRHLVESKNLQNKWHIDSCGTADYHIGSRPDDRGLKVLKSHNVKTGHRTRQVTEDDFRNFDFIFGMDESNISNLNRVKPSDGKAVVKLLGSYDPKNVKIIEDPYYGDEKDFETVYQQCMRCCEAFLAEQS